MTEKEIRFFSWLRRHAWPLAITALLLFCGNPAMADESLLDQARQLIEQHQAETTFELLYPLQASRSGEPNYDYLLGIAALEIQRPDIAVFALERAAALAPESAYIRADLAKAYAALGETDAAFAELKQAQRLSRDTSSIQVISRQLDAMAFENYNARGHLDAYLEFALGHSTNVNNATSTREMVIPVFGGFVFTLGNTSLKMGSNFHQQRGGVSASYPVGKGITLFGTVAGYSRDYVQHPEYDTAYLEGTVGIYSFSGRQQFTLALQSSSLELNGEDFRRTLGLNGQWRTAISEQTLAGIFAQAGELSYANAKMRDVMRYVGGALVSHTLGLPGKPVIYGSLYMACRLSDITWEESGLAGKSGSTTSYLPMQA